MLPELSPTLVLTDWVLDKVPPAIYAAKTFSDTFLHKLGTQHPQFEAFNTVVILATVYAELAFACWLLIKGSRIEQWKQHALALETAENGNLGVSGVRFHAASPNGTIRSNK